MTKKKVDGICPFTGKACSCKFAIPASDYAEDKASIDAAIADAEKRGANLLHTVTQGRRLMTEITAADGDKLRKGLGDPSKKHFCVEVQILPPEPPPRPQGFPRQHYH